jgi:P-type E1-E2 ATPase
VKVFARISPENKALIVRRHREMIAARMKARPFWKRIFGECSVKVGMVGDGANDLIAIKDADLGIGISSSDAVYSAAFAIKDLSQIVEILCESKSTERQIVELAQYCSIISFICITTALILITDVS